MFTMNSTDVLDKTNVVEGWLTQKEALFLFESAKLVGSENSIVEIGSWKGKSTVALLEGSKQGNSPIIYAVDPHTGSEEHREMYGKVDTYETFLQNIARFDNLGLIKPLRMTSMEALSHVGNNIGLLFVDGAHDYKNVNADLRYWSEKVVEGGRIIVHDTWNFLGPNLATAQRLITSNSIKDAGMVDTMTYWTKSFDVTYLDRLKNLVVLIKRPIIGRRGMNLMTKEEM